MIVAFVVPSQAATSINVSSYIMETIREIKTVVTNTVYDDAFIITDATLTEEHLTILSSQSAVLGAESDAMDIGTKALSQSIPDWAAVAVVLGLSLALLSFITLWLTDSKIPAILMPIGLALAAVGFWRSERAMRRENSVH
jgi:hypothetical protein